MVQVHMPCLLKGFQESLEHIAICCDMCYVDACETQFMMHTAYATLKMYNASMTGSAKHWMFSLAVNMAPLAAGHAALQLCTMHEV